MSQRVRVVLVDDQKYASDAYRRRLLDEFDVDYFADPREAVGHVNGNGPPDVLVLDWMFPALDGDVSVGGNEGQDVGLWVLQQILGTIRTGVLPVLVLTHRDLAAVQTAVDSLDPGAGIIRVRLKIHVPAKFVNGQVHELLSAAAARSRRV